MKLIKFDSKGRKTGEWLRYYRTGNVWHKGCFLQGKRTVEWIEYYTNTINQ